MKALKHKVKKEDFKRKKVLKSLLALKFYEKYFERAAVTQKSMVDVYHKNDPNNDEFSFVPKNLNKRYFHTLFEIPNFKKDFFGYLNNDFIREYRVTVQQKINCYVDLRIKKMLDQKNGQRESVDLVCKAIEENPKWKIPWTVKEAENAVFEFCLEFATTL